MPTWLTGLWKNTRSPGCRSPNATGRPTRACCELERGSVMPAWRKENDVRPEQSKLRGPAAPHRYDLPSWLAAVRSARTPAPDPEGSVGASTSGPR